METRLATKKRRLLAVYLDYILFSSFLGLLDYYFLPRSLNFVERLMVFALLEAIFYTRFATFGLWCLGMVRIKDRDPETGKMRRKTLVRSDLKENESGLTMFVAILLTLDGLKSMVRWTHEFVPAPFYGMELSREVSIAFDVLLGGLSLYAGVMVFRLTKRGLALGLFALSLNVLVPLTQPKAMTEYFVKRSEVRNERLGKQRHNEKLKEWAPYLPYATSGFYALPLLILLAYRRRFRLNI